MSKPEHFGQHWWRVIHGGAAGAKTMEKRIEFKRYVEVTIPTLLPCDSCSIHWRQNIVKYDINLYMNSEEQLLLWSYLIHSVVNQMLGKQDQPSYNEVKRQYLPEPGFTCTTVCSVDAIEHTAPPQPRTKPTRGTPSFRYR